jgi:hypothetical protein
MISTRKCFDNGEKTWQAAFLGMLPGIQSRLISAFKDLDPASKEEALAEGIAHCVVAYRRLHGRRQHMVATESTMAWYASRQVKRGRPAVGRMNAREPLSRYAQIGNHIQTDRLPNDWIDTLLEDRRTSIADRVALKIDIGAWLATLTQVMARIAKDLAYGFSTSEVAARYGVTASRISQLRRRLEESWFAFQQQAMLA